MIPFLRRWFGRRRPAREQTQIGTTDDIWRALAPPIDLRSPNAWDEYWDRHIAFGIPGLSDMLFSDRDLVGLMRRSDLKTILIAGNGLSLEPRVLAAAGFDVVVLDISPRAVECAQQIAIPDDQLKAMLGEDAARPGGRVQFVVGDVLEPGICAGPFDVVVERLTAQDYPDDSLGNFLTALSKRLSPHGILVTHCHDNSWRPGTEPRHRPGEWLLANGWITVRRLPDVKPAGRFAQLVSSTG